MKLSLALRSWASTLKGNDTEYRLQITLILVSKIKSVFVLVGFFNAAGNTCQVVCPFVEVSIVQIVLLLKYVLLNVLEPDNREEWAKQRSHGWHSNR